jgi:hypothetical protein
LIDNSFLNIALSIKDIRKTEMLLPIARRTAIVTPFLLGDHQVLKTAILSPQSYDREMFKCLYKHTQIYNDGVEEKYSYDELIAKTSNIDKLCLLWACYKSTYEHLGVREIACEKCGNKSKYKITLDELIDHPEQDAITIWEEASVPFYEYIYPIIIPYDEYEYVFDTSIPSIQKYNQVLGHISTAKIERNLKANSVLSGSEELAVLINKITIRKGGADITTSDKLQEILIVLETAIPSQISEDLQYQYAQRFEKYYPKFYTRLSCLSCKHDTKYNVDIETEFFRRILSGRDTMGEEL